MKHELIEQREQNDACIDSAESRKKKVKCQLTFKNEDQELNRVAEFMESVCDELQLDMHVAMKLQLAMEEMVTNVIFYAYPEGTTADITLTAESDGQELTFVLSDNGKPFDPTAKEDAARTGWHGYPDCQEHHERGELPAPGRGKPTDNEEENINKK